MRKNRRLLKTTLTFSSQDSPLAENSSNLRTSNLSKDPNAQMSFQSKDVLDNVSFLKLGGNLSACGLLRNVVAAASSLKAASCMSFRFSSFSSFRILSNKQIPPDSLLSRSSDTFPRTPMQLLGDMVERVCNSGHEEEEFSLQLSELGWGSCKEALDRICLSFGMFHISALTSTVLDVVLNIRVCKFQR
nr:hypothetical protein Iba_chr08cCG5070 [Ipomoea batatas]